MLCEDAVRNWGLTAQLDMLIEESSEMIQAVSKAKRYGILRRTDDLIEEMVDLEIMIGQLKVILDQYYHGFQNHYLTVREEKLTRLAVRVDGKNQEVG